MNRLFPALLLCAGLAGCGGDTGGKASAGDERAAPSAIRIVGSSTVYPFTTAVAEQFRQRFPQFPAPIVESTGTGGGLKLFCDSSGANSPDIANASRRIKKSELDACAKNGIARISEIQVGLDGIALAHSRAALAMQLTERQIYMALAANPFGKPQTYRSWKEIDSSLPDQRIEVLGPPPTSGTRDAFAELILQKGCETDPAMKALKAKDDAAFKKTCTALREDGAYVEAGENDNLIVQKLVANPTALGIFGYSYVEENLGRLVPVAIQGVTPTYETISSFQYPAARPLFIYVNVARASSRPGVKEFVRAYATEAAWGPNGYLAKRGLIAAPDAVRQKNAAVAASLAPMDPTGIEP